MKFTQATHLLLLLTALPALLAAPGCAQLPAAPHKAPIWVTGYYPVWEQQSNLPPSQIDYSALTQIVQFSIVPDATGALSQTGATAVTPAISQALIAPAHAAGDKVTICIGGSDSGPVIEPCLAEPLRDTFVANIVRFVTSRGYDGVDIDMEPIQDSDFPNFEAFIRELRAKLNAAGPNLLLTCAATPEPGNEPAMYASLAGCFDQINIMTYDLSGTWAGWKTWHNSSLYGDGAAMLTDEKPYPSVSGVLQRYIDAGSPRAKLGIGLAFYADIWSGATGPTQSIDGVGITSISYADLMDKYYTPSVYHWDNTAKAPYLSIAGATRADSKFISYDDTQLDTLKVLYAREQHIGGVTIWEIGDGHRANQPPGRQDPLLQAVKSAWMQPLPPGVGVNRP